MSFSINITKRERKRKLLSGQAVVHTRYVVNYADPKTGKRRQEFFERQKDAQSRRSELVVRVSDGLHVDDRKVPTVGQAIDHWLADKTGNVKSSTLTGYRIVVEHIRGPQSIEVPSKAPAGDKPPHRKVLPMLGAIKLTELTTADIRAWHRQVAEHSGSYTANRAKSHLRSILALAEEDFGVRAPSMPTGLGRDRHKPKKTILTPAQVGAVLEEAQRDVLYGPYYAFPFLAGTRPSEQLGLLWSEVEFDDNLIRICRIQERDGSLSEMTKTEAGTREIPMGPLLKSLLLEWQARCPRRDGELHRVFPGPGRLQPWPQPRVGGGGPLLYQNFRNRVWKPALKRLGLPHVTPHSARHLFISTMQAHGIEVGLVAKLAGHANAVVTLGHYTQAVRGGEAAVAALERAYGDQQSRSAS